MAGARAAWHLYRNNFAALMRLTIPIYVLLFLAVAGGYVLAVGGEDGVSTAVAVALLIFPQVVLTAVLGSILVAVASLLFERDDRRALAAVRQLRPRLRDAIVAGLLVALVSLVPFLLGPLVVLLVVFLEPLLGPPVVAHVIAHEDLGLRDAWRRTKELLRGRWLNVAMFLFTVSLGLNLLQSALLSVIAAGVGAVLEENLTLLFILLRGPIAGLLEAVTVPLLFAAMHVAYVHVRERALPQPAA